MGSAFCSRREPTKPRDLSTSRNGGLRDEGDRIGIGEVPTVIISTARGISHGTQRHIGKFTWTLCSPHDLQPLWAQGGGLERDGEWWGKWRQMVTWRDAGACGRMRMLFALRHHGVYPENGNRRGIHSRSPHHFTNRSVTNVDTIAYTIITRLRRHIFSKPEVFFLFNFTDFL